MRKKSPATTEPSHAALPAGSKWFMVTDPIEGYVNNRILKHLRGELIILSTDAAKLFKDRILEIPHGFHAR